MKIKYLGTGAAEGVPAMFCNCNICRNIILMGEEEFRTRSQVLIDDELSIDFPPEAYAHALKYKISLSKLKYVLVTHSHMDHFYAHDFILRGYKYAQLSENILRIYGNSEVQKVFAECTAREMKEEVLPHIEMNEIEPMQELQVGEYRVITIPAHHSKVEDCLLFYIEKQGKGLLHLHDTGRLPIEGIKFLKEKNAKVDLVTFDCTFADVTAGEVSRHMGIEDNMLMRDLLIENNIVKSNCKYVITHFSHNANPTRERMKALAVQHGCIAAYDGLEIEI